MNNPTGLPVGASGVLSGIRYRVIGRVVMGMTEDGETYYWQEFNLMDDSGRNATLVFEEGDAGPEWKLFMLFDPARPMSVTEAAGKSVGDVVNLAGSPVPITLVGQSRVYEIEGRPPEGVERGDVANYFNADTGLEMLVVSWTGNEIEFYRGLDVPAADVARAFNISTGVSLPSDRGAVPAAAIEEPGTGLTGKIVTAVLVAVMAFAGHTTWKRTRSASPTRKTATLVAPLTTGATGLLGGNRVTVAGHATVEIARVGSCYDWEEYVLSDGALLVGGINVGANEWFLLRPAQPDKPLSPQQAAALRLGNTVSIGGKALRVQDVFQCRVAAHEGSLTASGGFGLLARTENNLAIVRWTENALTCYAGNPVPEKEVLGGFGTKPPVSK